MIDKENVRLLPEEVSREEEAALAASLTWLDGEEVAAVEGFAGELAEELAVERQWDAGGSE